MNQENTSKFLRNFKRLGPGFITASTIIGAGSVVSFTNAGANFGYNLVWWLIVIAISMYVFGYAMRKYTVVSGKTVAEGVRTHFGKGWGIVVGISAIVGQIIYGIGNFIAVGLGFSILFPGLPLYVGGLIGLVACVIMYIMKNLYTKVENVTKVCVFIMVLIFIASFIVTAAHGSGDVVSKSIVGIPTGSFATMLAVLGTTCSLATFAWSAGLCKDKGYTEDDLKDGIVRTDCLVQTIVVILISFFCLFIGANLLAGTPIANAGELAGTLIGLFGVWIRPIFGVGFLAAAWSSQMMAPKLGVDIFFDCVGVENNKERKGNIINIIFLIFGAVVAIIVGGIPTQLLTIAQIGGIVSTPILGIMIMLLLNKESDMGEHKAKKSYSILLLVLYLIQMVVIVNNLINMLR